MSEMIVTLPFEMSIDKPVVEFRIGRSEEDYTDYPHQFLLSQVNLFDESINWALRIGSRPLDKGGYEDGIITIR